MKPTLSLPCAWANAAPALTLRTAAVARVRKRFIEVSFWVDVRRSCGVHGVSRSVGQRMREKTCGRSDHRGGLVAVRRMAAVGEFQQFGLRCTSGNTLDLLHRSVRVVVPLDGEQRAADGRQQVFDGPGGKCRVEPDVVPAPEGR